jgi:hypothetical protein
MTEVIARRIIEGRPYRSVDELERVKVIGKKQLEEIRPLLAVGSGRLADVSDVCQPRCDPTRR